MREVRFPLKFKLLVLMLVLIAASLMIFVGIALKTFREDKSAYIFEALLNKASSERIILGQKLGEGPLAVKNGSLVIADRDPSSRLGQHFSDESLYEIKVVIPQQGVFFQWRRGSLTMVGSEEATLLRPITGQSLNQAVREVSLGGKRYLYAYDYDPKQNFAYVVTLPYEKAYSATTYLVEKSISYGLFILGVAMVLSVLLARPLTYQLEKLLSVTREIARGNFEERVEIKGHDEVGALSDSVNDMAGKIVGFMNEMKEKARLENEVLVARLVQSSFFPNSSHKDSSLETHGHFEPATECGGDWWGFFEHKDWKVYFVADATGHGVPAALLTATINCCKTSLEFITETRPDILGKPHEILRYMNQAVYGAGKEIQVTCFVASFNRSTRELLFSNSSQTPPLLFNGDKAELVKEDFRPLIEANGPRLGQNHDSTYETFAVKLSSHDTIFFYTDGLTEAENLEGATFGQRRLIKSLARHGKGSPMTVIEGVMKDLKSFTSERPLQDDLTAVALKVIG